MNKRIKISDKPTEGLTASVLNTEIDKLRDRDAYLLHNINWQDKGFDMYAGMHTQLLKLAKQGDEDCIEMVAIAKRLHELNAEIKARTGESYSHLPKGFKPRTSYRK